MKTGTYEEAMKRLEEIVNLLEEGNLSLEQSLKLYEEGTRLAAYCNNCLNEAEQKIMELSQLEAAQNNR